jgi:hypothetical protein
LAVIVAASRHRQPPLAGAMIMHSLEHQRYRLDAIREFERLRQKAILDQLWSRLVRSENQLLPFAAIEPYLPRQRVYRGVKEIKLSQISGSVNRHTAFNRRFYPLGDDLQERWVNVRILGNTTGWEPVQLYQVGDLFFVEDGHHRISVAHQLGAQSIEAEVWEYQVPVRLEPGASLAEVINRLKAQPAIPAGPHQPLVSCLV